MPPEMYGTVQRVGDWYSMTVQNHEPLGPDRVVRKALAQALKGNYNDLVCAPLPLRLRELLDRLEEQENRRPSDRDLRRRNRKVV
jgi:hypothetical protein